MRQFGLCDENRIDTGWLANRKSIGTLPELQLRIIAAAHSPYFSRTALNVIFGFGGTASIDGIKRIMKNSLLLCLLFLLVSQTIHAQIKNDLEGINLKGNVKTVRIEKAKLTIENNELKEGKREPQELTTFDTKGYYTEREGLTNSITRKFANKYYPDGRIKEKKNLDSSEIQVFNYLKNQVEKVTQLEDGHILDRWIYTFDDKGNNIKQQYILVDENLGQRLLSPPDTVVYKYDMQGKLSETAYFNANGTGATFPFFSMHRYVNVYDGKNRIKERQAYKPDGNLIFKWTYKYNEKDYLEEVTRLSQTLEILSKVTYSDFDLVGNWTKSNSFKISVVESKTIIEPTEVEYRTITYYP